MPQGFPRLATGADDEEAREQELVRAIRAGNASSPRAWQELLTRYQDRLFGVCLRMVGSRDLAADLTQDAMVKVIEGLDSYDGRSKLSTWMIRVTMNVCLSKLRSEKLRRHASLEGLGGGGRSGGDSGRGDGSRGGASGADAGSVIGLGTRGVRGDSEPTADLSVERTEAQREVATALAALPNEQRALLVLRDCRDMDYDQIAQILDVPVGTVKSRLFRARAALREAIEAARGARSHGGARPGAPSSGPGQGE